MQSEFYNQPVVSWAKQNLSQPLEIKLRFAHRWTRLFLYFLLYLLPFLIITGFIFLKLTGGSNASWWGVSLCGGVLLLPPSIIVLIGIFTRQKLAKSLDSEGINSNLGQKYFWKDLYYIDHVSKRFRAGRVGHVVKDNQLEFVFVSSKVIIPPLIDNREKVWNLINSIPVQVRDDGVIRENK